MRQYGILDVKTILLCICETCIKYKDILTEIDSKLGDGDMGISMSRGARAVCHELEVLDENERDITKLCFSCAMAFNREAPSTLGTLLSFGLLEVGKHLNHSTKISEKEAVLIPGILADTIAARGKSQVGDKTILDALYPYAGVLEQAYGESGNIKTAFQMAAKAAEFGMESTKGIRAKTGRASWLNTRNMEYPDAGAVLCTLAGNALAGINR